jgi:hypothetical protein
MANEEEVILIKDAEEPSFVKGPEPGWDEKGFGKLCQIAFDLRSSIQGYKGEPIKVVIKEIDISFGNVFRLMLMATLASIPVFIVAGVIYVGAAMFLGSLGVALGD